MTFRKLSKLLVGLIIIFIVIVGFASGNHPIVLKWLTGAARLIGRAKNATVYTDGQVNKQVKIYYVDRYWNGEPADYYILHFPYADKSRLQFLSLNKKDNYAGGPASTNIKHYDIISGFLFQSDVGANFTPIQDDMKGFNFDPKLKFTDRQILLKIPPTVKELKCDSLRVVL